MLMMWSVTQSLTCGQTGGGALERVQIFILAEGLKIEFFLTLSGRESSLVQTFCESCEQLDITLPSVHMTRRFVIQGCPNLMKLFCLYTCTVCSMLVSLISILLLIGGWIHWCI